MVIAWSSPSRISEGTSVVASLEKTQIKSRTNWNFRIWWWNSTRCFLIIIILKFNIFLKFCIWCFQLQICFPGFFFHFQIFSTFSGLFQVQTFGPALAWGGVATQHLKDWPPGQRTSAIVRQQRWTWLVLVGSSQLLGWRTCLYLHQFTGTSLECVTTRQIKGTTAVQRHNEEIEDGIRTKETSAVKNERKSLMVNNRAA